MNLHSTTSPNFHNTVDIGFLQWPTILDIDEEVGTIKIRLQDAVFQWEDPRVKININQINETKLIQPPGFLPDPYFILIVPLENKCNSLIDENGRFELWTPEKIEVEGAVSSKVEHSRNPWGIHEFGIRFSDPINKTNPLIKVKINFVVTVECKFTYTNYPIDTQTCGLKFVSDKLNRLNPVLVDPRGKCNKSNKVYEQNGFHVSSLCKNGSYAGIEFFLKRDITTSLLQHYLPSATIVFVSQTSFVIPLSALPGRISLVVTLYLALINLFISEQVNLCTCIQPSQKCMKKLVVSNTFTNFFKFFHSPRAQQKQNLRQWELTCWCVWCLWLQQFFSYHY